jgi:hypothetical protein
MYLSPQTFIISLWWNLKNIFCKLFEICSTLLLTAMKLAFFYILYMSEIMQYLSVCLAYFTLHNDLRCIQVVPNSRVLFLFLWLKNISLLSMYHIFFTIHQLTYTTTVMSPILGYCEWCCNRYGSTGTCLAYLFQVISIILCWGVGLLDHMVVTFTTVCRTSVLFSIVTKLTYIPTSSVQEFPSLQVLTSTCSLLSFWL